MLAVDDVQQFVSEQPHKASRSGVTDVALELHPKPAPSSSSVIRPLRREAECSDIVEIDHVETPLARLVLRDRRWHVFQEITLLP